MIYYAPRTWLGRIASVLVAIVVIILAVFFFTVFLAVFSVLAVVMIAGALLGNRRGPAEVADDALEAEYSVENETDGRDQDELAEARRLEDHHGRRSDQTGS